MPPGANADQTLFWNTNVTDSWVALHEVLDRQFAPLSDVALAALNPSAGARILDIGCGCGANTLELAGRVGPDGEAVGVDISAPMLERARELAREGGLDNAHFVEADAQTAKLGPAYDGVFSRFGVMFFDDPVGAFLNIRGAMKQGAPLAFICWRRPDENPVLLAPYRAALDVFPVKPPKADPLAPGPFAFSDDKRILNILLEAGFSDVVISKHDQKVGGQPLELALEIAMRVGPLAGLLRDQPEARDAARARVVETLRRHETPEGVFLDAAVWVVTARA